MEQIGLKEILIGLVLFLQAISVKGYFRGLDTLDEIKKHLAALNGRVGTGEKLREAHERSDTDRHDNCEERLRDVERIIMGKP